jgi:uncharacterized phage protein (TIGR02216 family)
MRQDALGPVAADLSGLAARTLGWRPGEFWNATPAELATSLGIGGASEPLFDRDRLDALLQQDGQR